MKAILPIFILALFAPVVLAQCPYLSVSAVENAQVQAGVKAIYPITLTNEGITPQLVSLSAECDYPLECSFGQSPYVTLYPTQSATFQLQAQSSATGLFQIPLSISAGNNQNCDSKSLSLTALPAQEEPKDDFEFFFDPVANQSGRPGDEILYSLRITNNKDEKIFVRMSTEGFFKATTRFSAVDLEIAGKESKVATIKVTIPPGTPSSVHQQVFKARVTTNDAIQFFYDFPTQIFAYSDQLRLVLQNEPLKCTIAPHNEESKVNLVVRNDGEIEGPFDIEVNAGTQAFSTLSVNPTLLEVKQGDSQEVSISIKPKQSTTLDLYNYQFMLSYNGIPVFTRNYCFEVFAKTDFQVKTQQEYSVRKGEVEVLVPFEVFNNGSISQSFAIEVTPPKELLVKPDPGTFTLNAGERKQASLVVTPSKNMKTGKIKLPVVVRTSKFAKAYSFNLTILPEQETPGQEDITIRQQSVRAFAGVETRAFITVKNNLAKHLGNTRVLFEGIPPEWYSTQPVPLGANQVQGIPVVFKIPASQSPDAKNIIAIVETEGGKDVTGEMVLYIEKPESSLELEVRQSQTVEEAGKRVLFVQVTVKNKGDTPLGGIKARLPTGYVLVTQPDVLVLQPGESADLTLRVENPSEKIPIWLEAEDGTSSDPVSVTATPAKTDLPWMWILVAILVIIVLIYIAFNRPQERYSE